MARLTIGLVLVLALFTLSYAVPKRDHNDYSKNPHKIVCYFGSWANYHKAEPFKIEDVDTEMCTHVIYGFAKLDEYNYTIHPFDPYLETTWEPWNLKAYERFNGLRKSNPGLTTMIAIGGWYEGSEKYSDMAKDTTLRKKFVESAVDFLKTYDFDGLDVDWEYPGIRKGNPTVDPDTFISLLTELKEAFEPHGFLLTSAISPGKPNIDIAYKDHIPKINDLVDWANVMTYDYHGGWEDFLGHNAPLYKRPDETTGLNVYFNVNYTVHYLLDKGLKKDKFVMGVPFYGRAWSLESPTKVQLKDPVKGMSPAGFISGEEGVLGYNEICQFELANPSQWKNSYDPWYRAPYAYNGSIWVGFDNQESLSCKIAFLKEMGLSGGMVWSLENDDFKNRCGGGRYPLLKRVHSMLNGDKKNSFECNLGDVPTPTPTTTTPKPTTTEPTTTTTTPRPTTTEPTTTTTTPRPTTTEPTTPRPTTTEPTTTTTTPRPTTTEPTTPRPTTTEPTTTTTTSKPTPTTQSTEEAKVTKDLGNGHIVRCYKVGMIEHPTDIHKYVVCEFISSGPSKGWWIHIMGCAPGTKWAQVKLECILDD